MSRIGLYMNTIRYLKSSQIYYRCMRKLNRSMGLHYHYKPNVSSDSALKALKPLQSLDYDPKFLSRFDVDEICNDKVTFLHVARTSDWKTIWNDKENADLWRYNLHYFEYLLPLAKAYDDTDDKKYLNKAKDIIIRWIEENPEGDGGDGWASYTIALRLINWLEWFSLVEPAFRKDDKFNRTFRESIIQQYLHLATHLEKDLLANHYLEDLKTLVIVSLVLDDTSTFDLAIKKLELQLDEQILPDGMHFELSPMYHKIVFEDLLRVAVVLKEFNIQSRVLNSKLQLAADFLYSFEKDVNTTPLFNDTGDNVAKDGDVLLATAKDELGVEPHYRSAFPNAGYYLLEKDVSGHRAKVIFDAGAPGPVYASGHSHCDMLSFECYVDGDPLVVNAGTYEYAPGENRQYYRSTAAHNTAMRNGHEQSQCWAQFRLAKRAKPLSVEFDQEKSCVCATCENYLGESFTRCLTLENTGAIAVADTCHQGGSMVSMIHVALDDPTVIVDSGEVNEFVFRYAPEYGMAVECPAWRIESSAGEITYRIYCIEAEKGDDAKQ